MSDLMKNKEALKYVKVMLAQNQALAKIANVLESLVQGEQLVVDLGSKVEFLTGECKRLEGEYHDVSQQVEDAKDYAKKTSQMLRDKMEGEIKIHDEAVKAMAGDAATVITKLEDSIEKANKTHAMHMAKLQEARQTAVDNLRKAKDAYEDFKSKV